MIYIVGLGPGNRDYMTKKALDTLEKSDIIVGFNRAIDSLDFIEKRKIKVKKISEILNIINDLKNKKIISIIASGDPCFFGIAEYISKNIDDKIEVIAGISSFQYLMTKINKSWSRAYTGSLHGREEEFIKKVKENIISIWLCDSKNSPQKLCENLIKEKVNCNVIIGENLSYENEIILEGKPYEFINKSFSDLSVIIVERGDKDEIN
ncbi:precorrin-6y C5,15-methyltransferase (decarboxylating) subunit CbiE [Clostridium sp. Sa3CUN1]|uniref:Precorrin-6y C5,15-methyltransferase (Decarboxylating) subunit CbiE n=1 Tax=Clostridium gallinarum TaxID=2762246 RepID=A0ABR8Q4C5_9CLOT|nr:precorrin-6y C5,15-methyltransferase (decarboxylating) subunit CbiE [Clostridium gallinarum]MBD7915276.1 precorrin-6y C5,15-methyltransferase (decarboxylating) subunit CbiE [Clostridium gallinarum]